MTNKDKPVLSAMGGRLFFHCPGCKYAHCYNIKKGINQYGEALPVWSWDGDIVKPTFSPSLLIDGEYKKVIRCHLFVTNGSIQFLSDCEHNLVGKTVPMVPW